jgi:hypothetical protein
MIEQIGNEIDMSYGSVQSILNEYLSLQSESTHVCAKLCSSVCLCTPLND